MTSLPVAAARLCVDPVQGVPEIREGDDLARLIVEAAQERGVDLVDGDILVISSKCVSKAAGLRAPALDRADRVLEESVRVVAERATDGGVTRIVEAAAGPVMAGAGIDTSNVGADDEDDETALLLPRDPDGAAADLLRRMQDLLPSVGGSSCRLGVVISDTAGRPWRSGQIDFALGAAGLDVVDDLRGRTDADGRPLAVTIRALADEIAAAADLVKGKAAGVAACRVRGLQMHVHGRCTDSGARSLVRTGPGDWFALGHVEAVRAALGAAPGSAAAQRVGIPTVAGEESRDDQLERACRLAAPPEAVSERGDRRSDAGAAFAVTPAGIRVRTADEFSLGFVVSRVVVALAAEGFDAVVAPRDPSAGSPEAFVRAHYRSR